MKKTPMPKRYTLSVTAEQLMIIQNACEVVARLSMTQMHDALDCVCGEDGKAHVLSYDTKDAIQKIVRQEVGLHPNASWGIRGKNEICWEIYSVIRHRLSWDMAYAKGEAKSGEPRDWSKFLGVNYDEPMQLSGHPLAKVSSEDKNLQES